MPVKILSSTGGEDGSGGADKDPQVTEIQVGDKSYKPEEIENLVNQSALATKKLQDVASLNAALERYDTDADTFLNQAEGAFSVMTELMSAGVVDAKGNLLIDPKLVGKPAGGDPDDKLDSLDQQLDLSGVSDELKALLGNRSGQEPNKQDQVIAKALKTITDLSSTVDQLGKKIDAMDQTQYSMMRTNLQKDLKSQYQFLDDDDISRVIATAARTKKNVFDVAKTTAEKKLGDVAKLRELFAKEWNVDLKQFDANKINEGPSEGGAAALFQDKSFSFKKGKGKVSPRQAFQEYMRRSLQEQ